MKFLVTGGAGFIGSNIVDALLAQGDQVVVLDNMSTGKQKHIDEFSSNPAFSFIKGSITDTETCRNACEGIDYVLHEAAYISVPGSVEDPVFTHDTNVTGTANVFLAARDAGVKRVVWASSTSVYGNSDVLPNVETMPLNPLSPYAASKAAGEMFASAFSEVYDISIVSLRYYNVFGRRQDPFSLYAAVIPIFVSMLLKGERPIIYGDGGQTRDFVFIENIVQANIKAALDAKPEASGKAFNIGCGEKITITELFNMIAEELQSDITPDYREDRIGDVRDSIADISAAREGFGYDPKVNVRSGMKKSIGWYRENLV